MTNLQCKYNKIWDPHEKKIRQCKLNKVFNDFCTCHCKTIYNKYVFKIQAVYKGYYVRKKLKLYYKLPRDIQRKIIWHMNKDIYLRHFNSSIFKLIKNRYKKFCNNPIYLKILQNYFYAPYNIRDTKINLLDFLHQLYSILNLSIKYYSIIKHQKIMHYIKLIRNFTNAIISYVKHEYYKNIIFKYNLLYSF